MYFLASLGKASNYKVNLLIINTHNCRIEFAFYSHGIMHSHKRLH